MENQDTIDTDDILDEVNEFHLLYDFVSDFGLITENELNFNGDVESAKRYEANDQPISLVDFLDGFTFEDDNYTDTSRTTPDNHNGQSKIGSGNNSNNNMTQFVTVDGCSINNNNIYTSNQNSSTQVITPSYGENGNESVTDISYKTGSVKNEDERKTPSYLMSSNQPNILLTRYISPSKTQLTTFQQKNEQRTKYLLRSLKLWQGFINSGDLDKLKVLFDDILVENCVQINSTCPPIVGRDKLFDVQKSLLRNVPDYYFLITNIVRSKRRVISIKSNSFGTFPYANGNDKTVNSWNIFENTPIDQLDEHHKIQKQKYDTLKSQNKIMRFERSVTGYVMLSRDERRFSKVVSFNVKVYVH